MSENPYATHNTQMIAMPAMNQNLKWSLIALFGFVCAATFAFAFLSAEAWFLFAVNAFLMLFFQAMFRHGFNAYMNSLTEQPPEPVDSQP